MTQFLDKFKGRSTRIGKQGILQVLEQDFKPIVINSESHIKRKNNHHSNKAKSIELDKSQVSKEKIELPPIKLSLQNKSPNQKQLLGAKGSISSRRSVSRVSDLIKEKQQQLLQNMKSYPLRHKKSRRGSSFDNVPDQFQSFEIPQDEMRFLKSFQRYTNSRHFTIHRKMSQRGTTQSPQ